MSGLPFAGTGAAQARLRDAAARLAAVLPGDLEPPEATLSVDVPDGYDQITAIIEAAIRQLGKVPPLIRPTHLRTPARLPRLDQRRTGRRVLSLSEHPPSEATVSGETTDGCAHLCRGTVELSTLVIDRMTCV